MLILSFLSASIFLRINIAQTRIKVIKPRPQQKALSDSSVVNPLDRTEIYV